MGLTREGIILFRRMQRYGYEDDPDYQDDFGFDFGQRPYSSLPQEEEPEDTFEEPEIEDEEEEEEQPEGFFGGLDEDFFGQEDKELGEDDGSLPVVPEGLRGTTYRPPAPRPAPRPTPPVVETKPELKVETKPAPAVTEEEPDYSEVPEGLQDTTYRPPVVETPVEEPEVPEGLQGTTYRPPRCR